MKPLAIIQARMSSNRLPGKVLMEVGGGKLIDRIIDSARQSKNVKKIYVATSTHKSDDPLVEYLDDKEVSVYRGSLDNVFARYQKISLIEEKEFDSIIRLTGDCPLLDSNLIDDTLNYHYENNYEYTSTGLSKTFPLGQSVEVINLMEFLNINIDSLSPEDLEHVTRYIWKRPNQYFCGSFEYKNNKFPNPNELRLTVDEDDDVKLIREIIKGLNYDKRKNVSLDEIVEYLYANPQLIEINKHVKQIIT